jgi:rod shape-determining protein MreD
MQRHLLWASAVIVGALLQVTWLRAIRVAGVLPDLTLLLVVYFALVDGEERAMWTGVFGGVLQDIAGNMGLGHHVLGHVVVGYAAGKVTTRLITEHPAVKSGLVFCASIADGLLFTLLLYLQDPSIGALRMIGSRVVPASFYTAVATPLVFVVLDRLFRRYAPTAGGVS